MKIKKSLFVFLVIIIFIIIQSTVTAADVNKNNTFENIQELIDNASDGDEITLNGIYLGNGTPINVTKTLSFKELTIQSLMAKFIKNFNYFCK